MHWFSEMITGAGPCSAAKICSLCEPPALQGGLLSRIFTPLLSNRLNRSPHSLMLFLKKSNKLGSMRTGETQSPHFRTTSEAFRSLAIHCCPRKYKSKMHRVESGFVMYICTLFFVNLMETKVIDPLGSKWPCKLYTMMRQIGLWKGRFLALPYF